MDKKLHNIVSYLFIILIFIIPLIFSTSIVFNFQFSKIVPFFAVTFFAALVFIVLVFNDGKIKIPNNLIFAAALFTPITYIVSSFFSISPSGSFLGTGTEIGTASMISGLFLFMYFVTMFLRTKERAFLGYLAFTSSFLILAIFHSLRFIFGSGFLDFGIFDAVTLNTIGRFTDLGIVAGVATILSLTSIEFLSLEKRLKNLSYVVLVLSLFVLGIANFPIIIWGSSVGSSLSLMSLIGIFALVFFVYFVSSSYGSTKKSSSGVRKIPIASLIVLVVGIIFTYGGNPLQNAIASTFKIDPSIETRLLWTPTAELSWSTVTDFPQRTFVGYGPSQFAYKWMLDKPADINNSQVWNTPLSNGVGFIASSIVTVGLLGFISWLAFLVLLIWLGSKSLFIKEKDALSHFITVSSFLVSLYLWIGVFAYVPSIVGFILTFFFTGIFLGSLMRENVIKEKEIVFDSSKGKSFAFIMALIVVLLVLLFWAYKLGERVVVSVYENKAFSTLQLAQSKEEVEKAKTYLRMAGSLANEGVYARSLAEITLLQVNAILQDNTTPVEELRQEFQTRYQEATNYAQIAIASNPRSFDNFVTYGNVLSVGASLGIEGYYEGAKKSYEEAVKLNPKSPLIPFLLAELEISNKNLDAAKANLGDALSLKPNFIDAIVFLGRIQVGEGRIQDAIASFTVALSLDPGNQNLIDIIQSLRNGDVTGAQQQVATSTEESATSTDEDSDSTDN